MHTVAFIFTAGWAAVTTLIGTLGGTLGGVVMTQRASAKSERERAKSAAIERAADRAHERELRELELQDAQRGRLYADRRVAYATFLKRYGDYRRAQDSMSAWFRQVPTERLMDEQETAGRMSVAISDALEAMEAALTDLEVVASVDVKNAALALRPLVESASNQMRRGVVVAADALDDALTAREYERWERAVNDLNQGENRLREAMRSDVTSNL
jgi:hypothetical protein